ncbi:MAG TPA: glycosyltransferase [Mycobacteriales bacterium]|nr:glycosyltransferase [Mycobacteriales bacterium]
MGKADRSLHLHESDGINPYGRELLNVLSRGGMSGTASFPADMEWVPDIGPDFAIRRVLPGNHPSAKWRQVLRLAHGMCLLVVAAARRNTILISWTRTTVEDLLLCLLAGVGCDVISIAHNAELRGSPSRMRNRAYQRRMRTSARVVAHTPEALQQCLAHVGGNGNGHIARHPLYLAWVEAFASSRKSSTGEVKRLVLLGAVRDDKGAVDIVRIMSLLPSSLREQVQLTFAGPGRLEPDTAKSLDNLGVRVLGPFDKFVTDKELGEILAEADLCIAPYRRVTQSGSVMLALSVGLPVLAFATGGLIQTVSPQGLVPPDDMEAFAKALNDAWPDLELGRLREPRAVWLRESIREWDRALFG